MLEIDKVSSPLITGLQLGEVCLFMSLLSVVHTTKICSESEIICILDQVQITFLLEAALF